MPRPRCEICGLDEKHEDVADCMRDLMRYVIPEIRGTDKFKKIVQAGYDAMKQELARE